MSLLQRVERAQAAAEQAKADAEKARALAEAQGEAQAGRRSAPQPQPQPEPRAQLPVPVAPLPAPPSQAAAAVAGVASRDELLHEVRIRLQNEVIRAFDSILDVPPEEVRSRIEGIVNRLIDENGFAVTRSERERLAIEMVNEVTGFGPIEPLLADETITEVMVNGPRQIYIERGGKIQRVDVHFLNDEHVKRIIDRIITPMGRRIDETSPRVDARLPDGSRVNAIIEPLSLVGPVITVRKFAAKPYTVDDLIGFGTSTPEMFDFLRACIEAKVNLFVSGGTGSGKTTTLNVLSSFIPSEDRIITVEDAAELQLRQPHVVTLESRPPNLEGTGEITIRDLLRNSLHMRPDRIIVGECRAGEALDMIQAMTTGHDGSLSTGHANSPRDMLRRLETMVLMTGYEMPLRAIREQIASAVDLIVHTARLKDGSRKIVSITEVYGIEDDEILTQDIFTFEQTGFVDGRIEGYLKPTGVRPYFMSRFAANGIELPPGEFGIPPEDPSKPASPHVKSRWRAGTTAESADLGRLTVGLGRAVTAGGMVYVSAIGPVDLETGQVVGATIKEQARQCLRNLEAKLTEAGSSLDKVVWANWSLRDQSEFDTFNEEWLRWFTGDAPVGQGTLLPLSHRRAGFKVSIGVIAQA
ncbi:MAG TPA: ATPase, T2SS/T4P/T4SS family [Candidatus Limnocylindrales bacterium]